MCTLAEKAGVVCRQRCICNANAHCACMDSDLRVILYGDAQ